MRIARYLVNSMLSAKWASLFGCLLLLSACASSGGDQPEVSHDGLQRVQSSKVDLVYRSAEADFSQYSRVHIADVKVSFRANWLRNQNQERRSPSHKLSQEDANSIKVAIADRFREIFTEELEKGGYQVVAEPSAAGSNDDLLLLVPAIVDLDVTAPDVMAPGRTRTYTTSAGSMSLELEFQDSITGDVLGRVYDSRKAPDRRGHMTVSNSVTNRAEADRMLRRWAQMLVEGLDRAHGK